MPSRLLAVGSCSARVSNAVHAHSTLGGVGCINVCTAPGAHATVQMHATQQAPAAEGRTGEASVASRNLQCALAVHLLHHAGPAGQCLPVLHRYLAHRSRQRSAPALAVELSRLQCRVCPRSHKPSLPCSHARPRTNARRGPGVRPPRPRLLRALPHVVRRVLPHQAPGGAPRPGGHLL